MNLKELKINRNEIYYFYKLIFIDNILEFDFDYNGASTMFNSSNEIKFL